MPLQTDEVVFDEAIAALESDIDDLADRVSEMDPSSDQARALEDRANRLDTHRRGLEWARSEWDVESVTLGGLNAGEYGRLQDDLPNDAGDGASRIFFVAYGTVSAPYVADDREQTVANVSQLPPAFVKWAEAKINDLTHVGGDEGNRFYRSLRETAADETSTPPSG